MLVVERLFVKQFALCYYNVVCLSVCVSVCLISLVYCGQVAGWIRMSLGTDVGHIVLDGDPPPPQKVALQPPLLWFTDAMRRPMSIVAKWLDGSGYYLIQR